MFDKRQSLLPVDKISISSVATKVGITLTLCLASFFQSSCTSHSNASSSAKSRNAEPTVEIADNHSLPSPITFVRKCGEYLQFFDQFPEPCDPGVAFGIFITTQDGTQLWSKWYATCYQELITDHASLYPSFDLHTIPSNFIDTSIPLRVEERVMKNNQINIRYTWNVPINGLAPCLTLTSRALWVEDIERHLHARIIPSESVIQIYHDNTCSENFRNFLAEKISIAGSVIVLYNNKICAIGSICADSLLDETQGLINVPMIFSDVCVDINNNDCNNIASPRVLIVPNREYAANVTTRSSLLNNVIAIPLSN